MFSTSLKKIILWSFIIASPISVYAATETNVADAVKASKSISFQKTESLSIEKRNKRLKTASVVVTNTLLSTSLTLNSTPAARNNSFDFSVYNANTDLISDDDFDGFYHRFSVTIDADTLFNHALVYADLYLSYEGGAWIYYATSQNYDIHSDSSNDVFTIETELADGYPTGYYDVKIKLYDALTDDYLLTYDNLDDSSLYAIPLEDSLRDQDDTYFIPIEAEIIISHGAGSINLPTLLLLFVFLVIFRISRVFFKKASILKTSKN